MSEKVVYLKCDWCEEERHEDEADEADPGWIRVVVDGREYHFCSTECVVSYL